MFLEILGAITAYVLIAFLTEIQIRRHVTDPEWRVEFYYGSMLWPITVLLVILVCLFELSDNLIDKIARNTHANVSRKYVLDDLSLYTQDNEIQIDNKSRN